MSLGRWTVNTSGNERIDLPDFRNAIVTQIQADFRNIAQLYFDRAGVNRVIQRYQATKPSTTGIFTMAKDLPRGLQDSTNEWLNVNPDATDSLITINLASGATNYIEVKMLWTTDDLQTRAFWDTDIGFTGQEFFDDINVRTRLDESFQVNSVGFNGGVAIPLYQVVVDGGGNITSVTRADDLIWKSRAFALPSNFVRSSVYETQLTGIASLIDFTGAVVSEMKGSGQSMESAPWSNLKRLREYQSLFVTGGGNPRFQGSLGADTIAWDATISVRLAGRTGAFTVASGSFSITDGQCLYVDVPDGAPGGAVSAVATWTLLRIPKVGDTFQFNFPDATSHLFTWVSGAPGSQHEVQVGVSINASATNVRAAVNAAAGLTNKLVATGASAAVILTVGTTYPGEIGNLIYAVQNSPYLGWDKFQLQLASGTIGTALTVQTATFATMVLDPNAAGFVGKGVVILFLRAGSFVQGILPVQQKTILVTAAGATAVPSRSCRMMFDATAGAQSATLPSATNLEGVEIEICKIDSSGNAVTITGTVSGESNPTIPNQYTNESIFASGGLWYWR